ncbi:hypothetical protein SAMN04487944_1241, partial [Gracilibacillus ureilyticus]
MKGESYFKTLSFQVQYIIDWFLVAKKPIVLIFLRLRRGLSYVDAWLLLDISFGKTIYSHCRFYEWNR